jgi:hypothetical protein
LGGDFNTGLLFIIDRGDHFCEVLGGRVRNEEIVEVVVVNQGR